MLKKVATIEVVRSQIPVCKVEVCALGCGFDLCNYGDPM